MATSRMLFALLAAAGALAAASCEKAPSEVQLVSAPRAKVGGCSYYTPCCGMYISAYVDQYGGAQPPGIACPSTFDPEVHCLSINNSNFPPLFCGSNSGPTPTPCNADCICSNAPAESGGCTIFDEGGAFFNWFKVGTWHSPWPECGTGYTLVHVNGQVLCASSECMGGGSPPPPGGGGGYPCVPYKTCADYPPTCGYVSDGCNPEGLFCNTKRPCNDQ